MDGFFISQFRKISELRNGLGNFFIDVGGNEQITYVNHHVIRAGRTKIILADGMEVIRRNIASEMAVTDLGIA